MGRINSIMEVSEGSPTQSMRDAFAKLVKETEEANDKYNCSINDELKKFNKLIE